MRPAAPFCLLALSAIPLAAQDNPIPAPISIDQFSTLLERPPFRRLPGLSDSLVLSGAASLPAGKMVTVWNRATKESFIVTSTSPNAQGWKLTSLTESADLKSVAAVIASPSQSITLRFDPERLTPPKLDNKSRPAARSESQVVVEALLRGLDPLAAKSFESLTPTAQESFRKSFAGFLSTYPTSSDPQRLDFVRRGLAETPSDTPAPNAPAPNAPLTPPTSQP